MFRSFSVSIHIVRAFLVDKNPFYPGTCHAFNIKMCREFSIDEYDVILHGDLISFPIPILNFYKPTET